mmetsp:Transcript_87908/g.175848  ORF Transcript_87908/g.175848 Transcript_87908/m.175848 type:complete len:211 (-) Transcript_87908:44-676(-)
MGAACHSSFLGPHQRLGLFLHGGISRSVDASLRPQPHGPRRPFPLHERAELFPGHGLDSPVWLENRHHLGVCAHGCWVLAPQPRLAFFPAFVLRLPRPAPILAPSLRHRARGRKPAVFPVHAPTAERHLVRGQRKGSCDRRGHQLQPGGDWVGISDWRSHGLKPRKHPLLLQRHLRCGDRPLGGHLLQVSRQSAHAPLVVGSLRTSGGSK